MVIYKYKYTRRIIMITKCPICDSEFELNYSPVLNELIVCPECGSELEVINLNPLVLTEAPEAEEDWGE